MNTGLGLYIVVLYFEVCVVCALYMILRSGKEENPYVQIFRWVFSPLSLLCGLLFVNPDRKRIYYKKLISKLLIK